MNQHKPYTKIQLKFIYKNKTLPHAALAAAFNKKFRTKKNRDAIHSLCTRKGWLTGRTGRFEKGHIPWTAGTKGLGICKANKGSFEKGNRPANSLPVGSKIIDSYGYIKVKVAEPNIWKFKHLIIWENAHGKITPGYIIRFKDGNKLNCRLSNLIEINRQVHCYLNKNGYNETPEKFKPTFIAIAKVKIKVAALANG